MATSVGVSALVDMDTHGDRTLGPVLSGGFDEVVLAEVMDLPDVSKASHSDRIERLA